MSQGAPFLLSDVDSGSDPNGGSLELMRQLVVELRELGVSNPVELLRRGTVLWAARAICAFRSSPGRSVRWLEVVLADGASRLQVPSSFDRVDELERQRIASFDRLYLERTGREWPA